MKLYLARHGDFKNGRNRFYPEDSIPLSDLGRNQANNLVGNLVGQGISHIFCSELTRSRQTAKIVAEALGQKVVVTSTLNERRKPDEIIGVEDTAPQAKAVMDKILPDYYNPENIHHYNEDNYFDVLGRAQEFLGLLENTEGDILAISHYEAITVILSLIMFGDSLIPEIHNVAKSFFHLKTGEGVCVQRSGEGWRLCDTFQSGVISTSI